MITQTINGNEILLVTVPEGINDFKIHNGTYVKWLKICGMKKVVLPANGKHRIVGIGSNLTETQWQGLIEGIKFGSKPIFNNYNASSRDFRDIVESAFDTATASGLSLLKSLNLDPKTTLVIVKK